MHTGLRERLGLGRRLPAHGVKLCRAGAFPVNVGIENINIQHLAQIAEACWTLNQGHGPAIELQVRKVCNAIIHIVLCLVVRENDFKGSLGTNAILGKNQERKFTTTTIDSMSAGKTMQGFITMHHARASLVKLLGWDSEHLKTWQGRKQRPNPDIAQIHTLVFVQSVFSSQLRQTQAALNVNKVEHCLHVAVQRVVINQFQVKQFHIFKLKTLIEKSRLSKLESPPSHKGHRQLAKRPATHLRNNGRERQRGIFRECVT